MEVHKQGSQSYSQKVVKRYSESFKLHVLDELLAGKYTKKEATRKYNLGGSTITSWIKKYNKTKLLNRQLLIRMPKDIDREKALAKKVKDLEKALAQTQMESLMHRAYFEVLLEETGLDKEAFEKKQKAKQSKKQ